MQPYATPNRKSNPKEPVGRGIDCLYTSGQYRPESRKKKGSGSVVENVRRRCVRRRVLKGACQRESVRDNVCQRGER